MGHIAVAAGSFESSVVSEDSEIAKRIGDVNDDHDEKRDKRTSGFNFIVDIGAMLGVGGEAATCWSQFAELVCGGRS